SELRKAGPTIRDTFQGRTILIRYERKSKTAIATDEEGNPLKVFTLYWFAWYAFHPETQVWRGGK
ncbi:MAG: DUF3179 domain-containing protein, partial [Bacteroidetes bacterium]